MKEYFDDLWQALPEELEPPHFELRKSFLMSAVRPGARALDLGCGEGVFTRVLADAGAAVVGAEVAQSAIDRAQRAHPQLRFVLVAVDGPLPFEDGAFELVWASEVIEHIADTARWLSEVRRVLAPGGRLLLTTPNHGRTAVLVHGIEHYSEPLGDHLHLYTRRSLERTLREFGFDNIRVQTRVGLPPLRHVLLGEARR